MAKTTLEASPRTIRGKQVKQLRRSGLVPANVYGHGITSLALQIPAKVLEQAARQAGSSSLVELSVEGEAQPRNVLLRQLTYDALSRTPLHADFYQVRMDEPITAEVPIHFTGNAPAVRQEGGIVLPLLTHVRLHGLPALMPVAIAVPLASLEHIDDTIYVRDLKLPDGVEVLTEPAEIVTKVNAPHVTAEEVPAEVTEQPAQPAPEGGAPAAPES